MAPSQLGIFMRSDPAQQRANLEFHVQPLSLDKFGDPLHTFPAITLSACNLRPTSRGTVRPEIRRSQDAPLIAPNYLSTTQDRTVAADAMRATRRLMAQPALKAFPRMEYVPGPALATTPRRSCEGRGKISALRSFIRSGPRKDGTFEHGCRCGRRCALRVHGIEPAAGRRRFDHADHHVRQYQHTHRDDCRERRRNDSGGFPITRSTSPPSRPGRSQVWFDGAARYEVG
jgi:hypothetical protein